MVTKKASQTKEERKPVTFKLAPFLVKKLKHLAIDLDKTQSDLLEESIKDLLAKYSK